MLRRAKIATWATAFSLSLAGPLAVQVASDPAHAVTGVPQKTKDVSEPYDRNWVFRSTKIHECAFIEISGRITATQRYAYLLDAGGWDPRFFNWSNIKLRDPKIEVTGWPITSTGCDSTSTWSMSAVDMSQTWYDESCGLGISLAAGIPWSISATPTVHCGSYKAAHTSSTEGPGRDLFQANSGPAYIAAFEGAVTDSSGIAFDCDITVRVHRSGVGSDLFDKSPACAFLTPK